MLELARHMMRFPIKYLRSPRHELVKSEPLDDEIPVPGLLRTSSRGKIVVLDGSPSINDSGVPFLNMQSPFPWYYCCFQNLDR